MGPRSLVKFSVVLRVALGIGGWGKVEGPGFAVPPAAAGPGPARAVCHSGRCGFADILSRWVVPVFCAWVEFADCAIFRHFFVGRRVGDCYRTDVAIKMMSIQRWAPGVDRGRETAERADGESSWGFLLARTLARGALVSRMT